MKQKVVWNFLYPLDVNEDYNFYEKKNQNVIKTSVKSDIKIVLKRAAIIHN